MLHGGYLGVGVWRITYFFAYATSCSLLHALLQQHYMATCRSSWLALFVLDTGPYCALLRKSMAVLQWSPLLVTGMWLPQHVPANEGRE